MRMGRSGAEYKEGFKGAQPEAISSSCLQRIGIRKRDIPSRSIHISEPILSVDDRELYDEPYYRPRCKKNGAAVYVSWLLRYPNPIQISLKEHLPLFGIP